MKGRYFLLQKRNMRFMKGNTRLYRIIILLRLQMKNSNRNPQTHFALETLAEATASFHDLEVARDATSLSNPMQIEEIPEGQR